MYIKKNSKHPCFDPENCCELWPCSRKPSALIDPSLATVRAVVEKFCSLHAIPNWASLYELGIRPDQFPGLRNRAFQLFGKDIELVPADTMHTITEKLLAE